MNPKEQAEREAVVKEAMSWIGTPFHHRAAVKGVGVDCGLFLYEVFKRAGLIEGYSIPEYAPDFNLHRSDEWYLRLIQSYCVETLLPQPGDIVTYQYGRVVAHAAIITEFPMIVHSYRGRGVTLGDTTSPELASRTIAVYSFWKKGE